MAKKNEHFADAGAAAMAAIAAIQADADAKMQEQLENVKDAIAEKRSAIRAMEKRLKRWLRCKNKSPARPKPSPLVAGAAASGPG